jgi:CBS domain-containing protein
MQTNTAAGGAMYRFLGCTASQFMTRTVKAVARQTTMRELDALFEKHDFNAFPVVEKGKMLGIVSKFDFLRAFAFTSSQMVPHYNELMGRPVTDVMTEAVMHVDPTSPLTCVLQLMVSLKTRSFPVMNADHQLEGMISRQDVMRWRGPCFLRKHAVAEIKAGSTTQSRLRAPHLRRRKILDWCLISRSKIFGVEIHSRFNIETIEIGLQPLVGPCAPHVVKMQHEIPIGVQSA